VNYNRGVPGAPETVDFPRRIFARLGFAVCVTAFLVGASCKKESKAQDTGAVQAADRAVDKTPIEKIDVSGLDEKQQNSFFYLVDTFSSPCGKAHSLRTSVNTDASCKAAVYAVRYLAKMVADDFPEKNIRELWEAKYKNQGEKKAGFVLDGVPRVGPADAPVKLVEYYDYGCPACQELKPVIDEVMARNSNGVVAIYYKQYPLTEIHPNSMSAAQAAIAAHRQGMFKEMHDRLFAAKTKHQREHVMEYARDIGLNMEQFEADYDDAEKQVRLEMAEGGVNGVDHTPTVFINGREMVAPGLPDYYQFWIDEELALNRR
jgi:protein-disulfide isomerase